MSKTVISVEHLSKRYQLGVIGATSLQRDLNRWWARTRGRPDPYLKIGQEGLAERMGEYIWALDDINFKVQQGEALGIIGRNGAGKSTLLKILSRVTAPTKGKVKIKGRIGSLLEVGTGFHPELTGRENVYLNGAILGMTRAEVERKFDEIVDFSGVEKFIDTPVKRYSSGMYVRLAFAVAAHLQTDILIVDEVLAVGDAEFQKKCLGKMGNVAGEGRTVLFVSHNLTSVEKLCHKGIVIDGGRIELKGSQTEAISYYIKKIHDKNKVEDLNIRKDRQGDGRIRISKIELYDLEGKQIKLVNTGDTFDIYLHYVAQESYNINDVIFGITCVAPNGTYVFSSSIQHKSTRFTGKLAKSGTVALRVKNIPLVTGNFQLISVIRLKNHRVDIVDNAFSLQVVDLGYSNYLKGRTLAHGVCVIKGEWRFIS